MKKNKIIYKSYITLICLTFIVFLYLLVRPLKHNLEVANYDSKDRIKKKEFPSEVQEIINVEEENIVKLRIFLVDDKYDNLTISLSDENNNEIFSVSVKEYTVSEMIFECPPLSKGKYTFKMVDNDGDAIKLKTAKSNGTAYLQKDKKTTLQLITYRTENNYFCLWYPLFLLTFLISLYPFVRCEK